MTAFIVSALLCWGAPARADCMVIDRIDRVYQIQARLARDPDAGFFDTDIRLLRTTLRRLDNDAALDAVSGNRFFGAGADIVGLLDQTRAMLASASLTDPQSLRRYQGNDLRQRLDRVGAHLRDLRCSRDAVNAARAAAAAAMAPTAKGIGGDDGASSDDMSDVMRSLRDFGQELTRPRAVVGLMLAVGLALAVTPLIRQRLFLRRRRAKRHPAHYPTSYRQGTRITEGSLLDINCLGTKLARDDGHPLATGDGVDIAIDDDWVSGQVIWSNPHYSGIRFKRAIDLPAVRHVIRYSIHG